MRCFLVFFIFTLYCLGSFGHTVISISDSVILIKEVTVTSNRLSNYSSGYKVQTLDSSLLSKYPSSNLSQLLSVSGLLQVQAYGLGLSSVSMRGTTTNHTAVLWNGLNMQDMFNGGVDMSQIPAGFVDQVCIQYGGSGAMYGSGSIGGIIHLNNQLNYSQGFHGDVKSGFGSFANKFWGASTSFSNQKYSVFVKGFQTSASNDYPYKYYGSLRKLTNAAREQTGFLAGQAIKTSFNSELIAYYWFQGNNQNVMSTTVSDSHNYLSDSRNLGNIQWKYYGSVGTFCIRSGINHNLQIYNYSDKYQTLQSINEFEYNLRFSKKSLLSLGTNYTFEKGESQHHLTNSSRNRFSLFSAYKHLFFQSLNLYSNFREEIVNQTYTPFTFTFGFDLKVLNNFQLRGNVSKNYRLPTFNDLFWAAGGNVKLKSETGICKELGVKTFIESDVSKFSIENCVFSNSIDNLIQWQPKDGSATIWSAVNIGKVWSRGIENSIFCQFSLNGVITKFSASYSYTLSTNELLDNASLETYKKQLIYIPRHKGLGAIFLEYHNFGFFYNHQYSGLRYYIQDNSAFVHSYQTGNAGLYLNFKLFNYMFSAGINVNNIWDSSYQVVQSYPMPLRNYQINFKLNI